VSHDKVSRPGLPSVRDVDFEPKLLSRRSFLATSAAAVYSISARHLFAQVTIVLAARLHFRSRRILEFTLFINTAQRRFIDWRHHKEHWWQTRPQRQRALVLNNPFAT
jgi:hypothetical protein